MGTQTQTQAQTQAQTRTRMSIDEANANLNANVEETADSEAARRSQCPGQPECQWDSPEAWLVQSDSVDEEVSVGAMA
jgi:hypothetical protein